MFELLEHTADVGFRARGHTKAEMFSNAALALESVAVEMGGVEERNVYPLAVTGDDDESLLVNWLSEVLYYLDGRRVVMKRLEVQEISATSVRGQGLGEERDPVRHPPKLVIKGVTYHQLKITKDSRGWLAEVYLDI